MLIDNANANANANANTKHNKTYDLIFIRKRLC